jgi:glyoxylase-like metal-dependent hydrolase (beta-lactamase superfamily II)
MVSQPMIGARGVMKKYFILHPAVFKLDGGAMFGIIPKPLWSKVIAADELNRIELSLRVMLIQTDNRNILIDTGIGDYHGEKFDERFGVRGAKNPLVQLLKEKLNLDPGDITDLIISHLHFDHVGGLGENDPHQLLFPKATVHLHQNHYEYAQQPTLRDAGSFHQQYFAPLIAALDKDKKINWLDGEEGTILSDGSDTIYFKCSHGHTPYLMHAWDENFIYMADLVPTAHHVPLPWVMGYDIAPGQTTIDKMEFYQFISESNKTMIFEHDIKSWGAKIIFKDGEPKISERFGASEEKVMEIF